MSILLLILAGFVLYVDISRHYNSKIKELVEIFFGKLLRNEEKQDIFALMGASYMAGGFLITCLFFPKGLTITSWLILIISDCMAAMIGIRYGTPLPNGKSLIGAGAFFISSFFISIVSYFFINYHTSFLIIIISSAAAASVEFYSKQIKISDNFSIPFTYCLVTTILNFL